MSNFIQSSFWNNRCDLLYGCSCRLSIPEAKQTRSAPVAEYPEMAFLREVTFPEWYWPSRAVNLSDKGRSGMQGPTASTREVGKEKDRTPSEYLRGRRSASSLQIRILVRDLLTERHR